MANRRRKSSAKSASRIQPNCGGLNQPPCYPNQSIKRGYKGGGSTNINPKRNTRIQKRTNRNGGAIKGRVRRSKTKFEIGGVTNTNPYRSRPTPTTFRYGKGQVQGGDNTVSWVVNCGDAGSFDVPCGASGTENWTDGGNTNYGGVICTTSGCSVARTGGWLEKYRNRR